MSEVTTHQNRVLLLLLIVFLGLIFYNAYGSLGPTIRGTLAISLTATATVGILILWEYYSPDGRKLHKRLGQIRELPKALIEPSENSVKMGTDLELHIPIYLPDKIRSRHVHIIGATGSGKTESVILNFLQQDIARGLGSIILDAKGDASFVSSLRSWIPEDRLKFSTWVMKIP